MKEFNNNNLIKYDFEMEEIKLFDSFAGIGALHQSLKELGVPVKLVGTSEIDVDAIISYVAVHKIDINKIESLDIQQMRDYLMARNIGYDFKKNKSSIPRMKKDKLELLYKSCIATNNLGDISLINTNDIPNFDLFNCSFCCQDISISGKQKGLLNEDGSPTRSGLIKYGIEIIKNKKPKYIMIENVKNLIGKKFINDFYSIVNEIESYGYKCYYPKKENGQPICLNAKDYGIPQNRERIYVICIRNDIDDKNFNFPKKENAIKDIPNLVGGIGDINFGKQYRQGNRVYDSENIAMCLLSQPLGNNGGNSYLYKVKNTSNNFNFPKGFDSGLRLKDVLEENVDNKYYLSQEVQNRFKRNDIEDVDRNELNIVGTTAPDFRTIGDRDKTYGTNGIMSTLLMTDYKQPKQILEETNKIIKLNIPQIVKLRKYPVDIEKLKTILKDSKKVIGLSNKQISKILHQPLTKVEHWFRSDKCFSIPDSEIWQELKEILNIITNEFDKSITTFIEVEGKFEKANRVYLTNGIAPTITTLDGEKILEETNKKEFGILTDETNKNFFIDKYNRIQSFDIKENYIQWDTSGKGSNSQQDRAYYQDKLSPTLSCCNSNGDKSQVILANKEDIKETNLATDYRIRKLTPKECWRLMGFRDECIDRSIEIGISDSQLYKQAGNSIVVNVLYYIFKELFKNHIIYKNN